MLIKYTKLQNTCTVFLEILGKRSVGQVEWWFEQMAGRRWIREAEDWTKRSANGKGLWPLVDCDRLMTAGRNSTMVSYLIENRLKEVQARSKQFFRRCYFIVFLKNKYLNKKTEVETVFRRLKSRLTWFFVKKDSRMQLSLFSCR